MDAHAHLTGLGWRGTGNSIDETNRGLKKPLLISHKTDLHGLGSKSQKEKQADQWWLNAYSSALKDFGEGKKSALTGVREYGVQRGGLYGFFVRGEVLGSTIQDCALSATTAGDEKSYSVSADSSISINPTESSDSVYGSTRKELLDNSCIFSNTTNDTSTFSSTSSEQTPIMARPFFKRNTSLMTGENAMPLGKNRIMEAREEKDKKRKRDEESASEKVDQRVNGESEHPVKKKGKGSAVAVEAIRMPVAMEKSKKSEKKPEHETVKEVDTKSAVKRKSRKDGKGKGGKSEPASELEAVEAIKNKPKIAKKVSAAGTATASVSEALGDSELKKEKHDKETVPIERQDARTEKASNSREKDAEKQARREEKKVRRAEKQESKRKTNGGPVDDAPSSVYDISVLKMNEQIMPKEEQKPLSKKKKQKYAVKAAAKGMSAEEYVARRESKKAKAAKKQERNTVSDESRKSAADRLLARAMATITSSRNSTEESTSG